MRRRFMKRKLKKGLGALGESRDSGLKGDSIIGPGT
jgi:hypothetical protein